MSQSNLSSFLKGCSHRTLRSHLSHRPVSVMPRSLFLKRKTHTFQSPQPIASFFAFLKVCNLFLCVLYDKNNQKKQTFKVLQLESTYCAQRHTHTHKYTCTVISLTYQTHTDQYIIFKERQYADLKKKKSQQSSSSAWCHTHRREHAKINRKTKHL